VIGLEAPVDQHVRRAIPDPHIFLGPAGKHIGARITH
jgi:hypothetical protein